MRIDANGKSSRQRGKGTRLNTVFYCIQSGPRRDEARRMLQPQELVVARLLPTIRARLARELVHTYKMKQVGLAPSMGMTQPAGSQYNSISRSADHEIFHLIPERRALQ